MDLSKEDIFSDEENLTLHSDISPFTLALRVKSFYSEKEFDKFVKCVERLVRSSGEYKQWVAYIIDTLGVRECALTKENVAECNIEIHHHPITLYTVCKSLIVDNINKEIEFCTFDIATKVIELHFKNKVGYIPLLSDLHKKYHSGFLQLPIELVKGDYKHILNTFPVDENERDRIYSLCNVKAKDCAKLNWSKGDYPGVEETVVATDD
jgi:hypothetical protein